MQTIMDKYENKPWLEYDINEEYYLENIYKEIENVLKKKNEAQLSLF